MDCLFCKISKKEIMSNIIYEDDKYLGFLDIDQSTIGHTLIIPKNHYESIKELDKDTLYEMYQIAEKLSILLEEKLNCKGFTYMINYLDAQEVKHVHLHILPDYNLKKEKMTTEEIFRILKSEY